MAAGVGADLCRAPDPSLDPLLRLQGRKRVAAALRPIYTAATVDAAADTMDTFELEHGERYPGMVALWRGSWERFTPFLAYPAVIRKIVYTTNMIESVNCQLRKASKTRGHFPDDQSCSS